MRLVVILGVSLVAACGESKGDAEASDASVSDAPLETSAMDAPPADSQRSLEGGACLASGVAGDTCCVAGALRPLPSQAKTVIDWTDISSIPTGTCDEYLFAEVPYRRGYELPSDPAAYPVKLVLPAVADEDPACEAVCNEFEPFTAFGIALEVAPELIGAQQGLGIHVPAPWKFVSGGCGEACPYPCLGGYQEFGVRSCTTLFHGDFGVSTGSAPAPSVEVWIELVDAPATPGGFGAPSCCLYE